LGLGAIVEWLLLRLFKIVYTWSPVSI
jgi:hypothetical protein